MDKVKRVVDFSRNLTEGNLNQMTENLRKELNRTVFIELELVSFDHIETIDIEMRYRISIIPGIGKKKCSTWSYKSWSDLLEKYYKLMKGDLSE